MTDSEQPTADLSRDDALKSAATTPVVAATKLAARVKWIGSLIGAIAVLAIIAAVILGVQFATASSELKAEQGRLAIARHQLSSARDDADAAASSERDAQAKLQQEESAYDALERSAEYTACISYYGAYAQGSGLSASVAVDIAYSSCADESSWNIKVKQAP